MHLAVLAASAALHGQLLTILFWKDITKMEDSDFTKRLILKFRELTEENQLKCLVWIEEMKCKYLTAAEVQQASR